jgi:acetoin utilization deacetylase AcuC-like enzyme
MIDIFYNKHYVAAKEAFDTTRKSKDIAEKIGLNNLKDPKHAVNLAIHGIQEAHSPEYVESLMTGEPEWLANTNAFDWDEGIWKMAVNSTAGIIAACESVITAMSKLPRENWYPYLIAGSLSSGLHHARRDEGSGYCTVNGLAIAANLLKDQNIVILDFDAHCGGGTISMLRELNIDNRVHQYDISTNMFDSYEADDRHHITIATTDEEYITDVETTLDHFIDWDTTDLILYNAGVDPYPEISHDTLKERDQQVFNKCIEQGTPCVFVLAGGYTNSQDADSLAESHLNTINAANRACHPLW